MTRPRYFAIFGAMRTGSNLLERTIEALGDTVCYGEVFNPSFIGGPMKVDARGWTPKTRDAEPLEFLADLLQRDTRLPGFRIFQGHTEIALRFALADPDCARIILRRDPLDSYISLKIARETDQWVLRYPRRRISVRIRFDLAEYTRYREAQDAHYAWMDQVMADAGTDALRIDYARLKTPEVLQAVARHIGSTGNPPDTAPLIRQNPGPLSLKVSNYAEMCAALGLEPEAAAPGAASLASEIPDVLAPPQGLHAFAPIDGPGFGPGVAFLNWLDHRGDPAGSQPLGQVLDAAARGEAFASRGSDTLEERIVFTIVCDPLERVYALLQEELFGPGWKHAAIRRLLAEQVGALPEGRGALRDPAAFPVDLARSTLRAYLELIDTALSGAGRIVPPHAWYPQVDQITALEARQRIARVLNLHELPTFIRRQCARVSVPVPSARDLEQILTAGRLRVPAIETVADPDIRDRVRRIYAADETAFGSDAG
ncbi:MAG: hypothetical protein AAFV19_05190 [Pseudomonadota bacterium]